MVDSAMDKMQKGKRPQEMAEARFKQMTLKGKPKKMPSPPTEKEMNLKRSNNLTKSQKTLPEFLKKKIIEAKKSGAGYSGD